MPQYYDPDTGKPIAAPQAQDSGKQYYDPDTGKPVSSPGAAPPLGALIATPDTGTSYMQDVTNDLRGGGARTIVGRGLGFLQGRGSKGYTGLESGSTPEAADIMGSVPLGLAKIATGSAEDREGHPLTGLKDMVSGGLQTTTIPSMFAGPEAARSAIEAIPSRVHAGAVLEDIRNAAADVPVIPRNTMPELQRWNELTEAGGRTAKPMTKLAGRLQDILTPVTGQAPAAPMNFPEARDIYSNVTDLTHKTALQKLMNRGLKPTMLRQAIGVRGGLNRDLTDAAETIGRGQHYADAMKEYAQASRLSQLIKRSLYGAGIIGAGEVANKLGLAGKIGLGASRTAIGQ